MRDSRMLVLFGFIVQLFLLLVSCGRSGFDFLEEEQGVPEENMETGTGTEFDECPQDDQKIRPGECGCGVPDNDSDGDGSPDCNDGCPDDGNRTDPGFCDCGISEDDGTCDAIQFLDIKLTASDAQVEDFFGSCVSISGDVAIVGASWENGGDGDSRSWAGAAYIFRKVNGKWKQQKKITATDAQNFDEFGSSVSIFEDVAIVGAKYDDDGEDDTGAAYIFQFENGGWMEKQKLTASDGQADDRFGSSVSISGNIIIVGAPYEDGVIGDPIDPHDGPGAAYIFKLVDGEWKEKKKLTALHAQKHGRFGESVSISEDVAMIGAVEENLGKGAVYIFQMFNGEWVEKMLYASDAQADDHFGKSISISGDVAIVGAHGEDGGDGDPMTLAGAAYIFQLVDGQWVEQKKLCASDAQEYDLFGVSVSISGDVAIVGAYGEDGGDGDPMVTAGAAYIFQLINGEWVEKKKLCASDAQEYDQFGVSVSISGDFAIVGAQCEKGGDGDPMTWAGAAYIY